MKAAAHVELVPFPADDLSTITLKVMKVKLELDSDSTISRIVLKTLQEAVDGIIWTTLKFKNEFTVTLPEDVVKQVPLEGVTLKIENGYMLLGADAVDLDKIVPDTNPTMFPDEDQAVIIAEDNVVLVSFD